MIKALIIDDEPLARMVVKEYLESHPGIHVLQECGDGFEGVKAIHQHQPDLIFLDIQMPKINGFEMMELVENPPAVIFTTAYDEYALRAFETHAVDYLLKPFSSERFDKALSRFMNIAQRQQQVENTIAMVQADSENVLPADRVVVKTAGKIRIIPLHTIHFIEAADDYTKIHTADGSFLKNKTMAFFERSLPPANFVRTHRSYIINIAEITRIEPLEKDNHVAVLRSGHKVPVSQGGYGKLKTVLGF